MRCVTTLPFPLAFPLPSTGLGSLETRSVHQQEELKPCYEEGNRSLNGVEEPGYYINSPESVTRSTRYAIRERRRSGSSGATVYPTVPYLRPRRLERQPIRRYQLDP